MDDLLPNYIEIEGNRYGRWTVVERAGRDGVKGTRWLCRCDCGVERVVDGGHLRYGRTKSCGCLRKDSARERGRKRGGLQGDRV